MKSQKPTKVKKSILILITASLVAVVFLTGCNSPNQKVENAKSAVVEANKDLQQANSELMADINKYREETTAKIAANDSMITVLKANVASKSGDGKAALEKQLAVLDQKNADMKKKLADYKVEGKEQWETFKTGFNHDMDSLSSAFKYLIAKKS
ncbi:MAG TPA: hypothetical protein VJ964_02015 [Balneolaceae bacterium]|nr:hypothetical protein [Balneolaceae bacterium]